MKNSTEINSMYKFNEQIYGKDKIVTAVVRDFIDKYPDVSAPVLKSLFAKNIVVTSKKRSNGLCDNIIRLGTKTVVVTNNWSKNNIGNFLKFVKKTLKEDISIVSKKGLKEFSTV